MWEVELRARIGSIGIPLWRTTEPDLVSPIVVALKRRLRQASTTSGLSEAGRRVASTWLGLLEAIEERMGSWVVSLSCVDGIGSNDSHQ
jgi:hypothetical protein